MLDTSDRLSLLALIVAVVALIVSGWQLAQQLFATATDGKRFCQGSVMGIWARKTRLSWRWSQIRFETKYTTPEIRMTSGIEDETKTSTRAKRVAQYLRLVYKIPALGWLVEVFNGPPSDWSGYFEVTSDQVDLPLEMRKTTRPDKDPVTISKAEAVSWWIVKTWCRTYSEDSPDTVSWPILLEWIYDNQIKSIRKVELRETNGEPNGVDDTVDIKKLEQGGRKEGSEPPYKTLSSEERDQFEDRVVVRLVERSWDLIPPDVVRPLAKSTVGTMIVVAHRFGMSWLGEFNPSEGRMNAAGCGHTMTSETVRGSGMVLQYNNHQESKLLKNFTGSGRGLNIDEYLSPTFIADQLHRGRLPIENAAVHRRDEEQHIDLIDVTRKLDQYTFLTRLGVNNADMETLKDQKHQNQFGSPGRGLKHSLEEAVSLLCPIPTLPDSKARWIVWPFRSFRQPYTPFRQKDGVQELRNQLSEYINANKPGTNIMQDRADSSIRYLTRSPLECLDFLLAAFKSLRNNHNAPTAASERKAAETYRQIVEIHEQTSTVFAELSKSRQLDGETSNPFLLDMAGAQIALAVKHGRNADKIAISEGAKEDQSEGETRRRFVQELARLYVEDLHESGERTIRKHLKRTGYVAKLKPGEVPALWWTAVVRSVCWFMSVQIRLPETQIPSMWYDSQTPVYIT